VICAVHSTKPGGLVFCCGTPVQESDGALDTHQGLLSAHLDRFSFSAGLMTNIQLETHVRRYMCGDMLHLMLCIATAS